MLTEFALNILKYHRRYFLAGTKLNVILVITFTSQDLHSYIEKGHLKAKGVKRNHDRDC
jgi:hypothetical protein